MKRLLLLFALALVLVACGGDSNDDEPTTAPTATTGAGQVEPTATTVEPPPTLAELPTQPSPVASPIGSASPVASPVLSLPASPLATPMASPMASPVAVVSTPRASWMLEGTVMLPGVENEDFVLGGDGCLGLGEYAGVGAGQQVVIRDASGAIVGLTNLTASGSSSQCVWTFEVEVPVSGFYTVSLPMLFERSYSDADIAILDGRLQITLP